MKQVKDSPRGNVRIGYDNRVYKTYRGRLAEERYHNEKKLLRLLERRGCDFVPRVLDSDDDALLLVLSHCGHPIKAMTQEKMDKIYTELEQYGVRHDDQAMRNITYEANRGRFCVIDFEFAKPVDSDAPVTLGWSRVGWAGAVDAGRFRQRNDDTFLAFTIDEEGFRQLPEEGEAGIEGGDLVFVVSDGMGGAAAGDLASQMIAGRLREMIPLTYQRAANNLYPDRPGVLEDSLVKVHRAVNRLAEERPHLAGMGAAVTICWLAPENAYFGHVGDTRLYRLRQGVLEQMTEDHSRAWQEFKRGKINERQWRMHPRRHIIEQAIGAGVQEIAPQIGALPLRRGDWLLMCSDGLIGGLWDKRLKELMGRARPGLAPNELTCALLSKSLEEDGRDNIGLVTINIC